MQHTLVAVFDNRADAQSALDELLASGFTRENVRMSGSSGASTTTGSTTSTASAADTDTGFASGIKNFFSDLFGDDDSVNRVNRYEGAVTRGQHVVTLSADSLPEVERAADIVERFGPTDIDEHSSGSGQVGTAGALLSGSQSGMSASSMSAQSAQTSTSQQRDTLASGSLQRDTASQSIPVVEEQLKIGKREVQRGGVRIFSRVVETPVNESVGLREEHVDVRRRAVNQPVSGAEAGLFKEQTIEMRETAEEAVIEKSVRIVEEVSIGKQVNERQEQITDTLRRTEVDVERLGATTGTRDDTYYRNHFQSTYGTSGASYDDYAPAYGYGTQMRSQYAGRQWDDVEGDLRSDWESRNAGGASTWEKVKAAVRHGWDRLTN